MAAGAAAIIPKIATADQKKDSRRHPEEKN